MFDLEALYLAVPVVGRRNNFSDAAAYVALVPLVVAAEAKTELSMVRVSSPIRSLVPPE